MLQARLPPRMPRVGEVLIQEGAVSSAGLRRALTFQRYAGHGLRLGTILVGWNLADEEALLRALSRFHECGAVPWSDLCRISRETAALLPAEVAQQVRAIPFKEELKAIHVAFANPSDLAAVDRVSSVLPRRVIPAVALEIRILQAHVIFYEVGVPPDHRPILLKLLESFDTTTAEGRSTSRGRIAAAPGEPSPAEEAEEVAEPVDEAPQSPVSPQPSPADQARPIAAVRPVADSGAEKGWQTAAGLWTTGDDAQDELAGENTLEEPTDLEPPAPPTAADIDDLPRPGREQVARAVLDTFIHDMPRTLVFFLDKDHLFGVYGKGVRASANEIRRIHLPPADGSILQRVRETHTPHFGRPVEEFWPAPLAVLCGLDPPECAVFPLESSRGLVGLLYADRGGRPMLERDFGELTSAAAFLANALGSSPHLTT